MTGNDPGAYSKLSGIIAILMVFGGLLMSANIFGNIFDIQKEINKKDQKITESLTQANNLMFYLKLDAKL